jgi:hypothetical protein
MRQNAANPIHRLGYLFGGVSRHVLSHRVAEQLAARFFGPLSQALCTSKHVVRDGNRRLHTFSITRRLCVSTLFQIRRRFPGDPGVVIGGVADSFVLRSDAFFNRCDFAVGKDRKAIDAVCNRSRLRSAPGFGSSV